MSKNRYGLDQSYISENLEILLRDIENYRPDEMQRALARLSEACAPTTPNPNPTE